MSPNMESFLLKISWEIKENSQFPTVHARISCLMCMCIWIKLRSAEEFVCSRLKHFRHYTQSKAHDRFWGKRNKWIKEVRGFIWAHTSTQSIHSLRKRLNSWKISLILLDQLMGFSKWLQNNKYNPWFLCRSVRRVLWNSSIPQHPLMFSVLGRGHEQPRKHEQYGACLMF